VSISFLCFSLFLSRGFEKFFSPTIAFFSTDGLHHSWAVITHLISPLDTYNYNDFFLNVNTFFKSYFFNNRARVIQNICSMTGRAYKYTKKGLFIQSLSVSRLCCQHRTLYLSTLCGLVLHHRKVFHSHRQPLLILVFHTFRFLFHRTVHF